MLQDVAHAQNHHSMADDQNSLAAVFTRQHFGSAAQAEDDIAPALAARRPVIEFAEQSAEFSLVRIAFHDADGGEAIENSKFLFAESLVDDQRVGIFAHAGSLDDETRGVPRAEVWRGEDDVGPLLL